jgi:pyrroloquinoline quinone biosynthesis protein B
MGHLPLSGPGGMIEWLDACRRARKAASSTSTTPIPSSTRTRRSAPLRATASRSAIEVCEDGMEIVL